MARRISFLARTRVRRRVSFRSGGRRISFTARIPSRRRRRVTFYSRR